MPAYLINSAVRFGIFAAQAAMVVDTVALAQRLPPPAKTVLDAARVEVPLDLSGDMPIVAGEISGEKNLRLLIDTGAGANCMLDDDLARRLKLEPIRTVLVRDPSGAVQSVEIVSLKSVTIGGIRFEDLYGLVHDLEAHAEFDIDAIVGFPAFADCLLTLDYPSSRLLVEKAALRKAADQNIVPFSLYEGAPLIQTTIAGIDAPCVIDSGATSTSVASDFEHRVPLEAPPREVARLHMMGGDVAARKARLDGEIAFAGSALHQPIVCFLGRTAYLGHDVLEHFAITFDQQRALVRFQRDPAKPAAEPIAFPPSCYAGFGAQRCEAGRRVEYVLDDSPAVRAGIQIGDLITTVNGRSVFDFDGGAWRDLFEAPGALDLEIKRGGEVRSLRVDIVVAVK